MDGQALDRALDQRAVAGLRIPERAPEAAFLQRLLERRDQLRHLEGLGEVAEGRAVHGLDGRGDRAVAGDEDDLRVGARRADGAQEVEPGDVGQPDIDDGGVHGRRGQPLETGIPGRSRLDGVTVQLEHVADRMTGPGVVVDDEDATGFDHPPPGAPGAVGPVTRPRRASTQSMSSGFGKTVSAVACLASSTSSSRVNAVIMITLSPGASPFICLSASTPLRPGIWMSMSTASYGMRRTIATAASPEWAVSTRYRRAERSVRKSPEYRFPDRVGDAGQPFGLLPQATLRRGVVGAGGGLPEARGGRCRRCGGRSRRGGGCAGSGGPRRRTSGAPGLG